MSSVVLSVRPVVQKHDTMEARDVDPRYPSSEGTSKIIAACFEAHNESGSGKEMEDGTDAETDPCVVEICPSSW